MWNICVLKKYCICYLVVKATQAFKTIHYTVSCAGITFKFKYITNCLINLFVMLNFRLILMAQTDFTVNQWCFVCSLLSSMICLLRTVHALNLFFFLSINLIWAEFLRRCQVELKKRWTVQLVELQQLDLIFKFENDAILPILQFNFLKFVLEQQHRLLPPAPGSYTILDNFDN